MRRLLLIAFFISLASKASAQRIHFTELSNRWNFICDMDSEPPFSSFNTYARWIGDSAIDGNRYSFTIDYSNALPTPEWLFFRDDTASKKVYYRKSATDTDKIYMDFTLQLHDTIEVNKVKSFILSLSSYVFNGNTYVSQTLVPIDSFGRQYNPYVLIEGIGARYGFFYPLHLYEENFSASEPPLCSICSFSDTNQFASISDCSLAIESKGLNQESITIQPNPIQDNSTIHFPLLKEGELVVYDAFGQLLFQEKIANQGTFPIGLKLPQVGMYYFKIVSKDSQFRGKIVRL